VGLPKEIPCQMELPRMTASCVQAGRGEGNETSETPAAKIMFQLFSSSSSSFPLFFFFSSPRVSAPPPRSISRAEARQRVFTVNIPEEHLHVTTRRRIQKVRVRFPPSTAPASRPVHTDGGDARREVMFASLLTRSLVTPSALKPVRSEAEERASGSILCLPHSRN